MRSDFSGNFDEFKRHMKRIFSWANDNIEYSMLWSWRSLPDSFSGSDIDILVMPESIDKFCNYLSTIGYVIGDFYNTNSSFWSDSHTGYRQHGSKKHNHVRALWKDRANGWWFDIVTEPCTGCSTPLVQVLEKDFCDSIIDSRELKGMVYAPSLECEVILLLVRCIFTCGFKDKYIDFFETKKNSLDLDVLFKLIQMVFFAPRYVYRHFLESSYSQLNRFCAPCKNRSFLMNAVNFRKNSNYKRAHNFEFSALRLDSPSCFPFFCNKPIKIFSGMFAFFLTDGGQYGLKFWKDKQDFMTRVKLFNKVRKLLPHNTPRIYQVISVRILHDKNVFYDGPALLMENIRGVKFTDWCRAKTNSSIEAMRNEIKRLVDVLKSETTFSCMQLSSKEKQMLWDQVDYNVIVCDEKPFLFDFSSILID